jgi:tRNA nucleotidyltransferase (CCA-adding enzyme)
LTIQDALFHPEQDEYGHHTVWAHTTATVDIAGKLARMYNLKEEPTLALLLAALFHDVGKSTSTRWEFKRGRMTVTSILHDSRGVAMADEALTRLKVETRKGYPLKKVVLNLIKNHHRIYNLYTNKDDIGFKTITRVVRDLEGEDLLLVLLDFADRQSRQPDPLSFSDLDGVSQWYLDKKDAWNISQESIQPLIMGRDLKELGVPPGTEMGRYLKLLYEMQLDGEFETKEAGLEIFKTRISGQSGES